VNKPIDVDPQKGIVKQLLTNPDLDEQYVVKRSTKRSLKEVQRAYRQELYDDEADVGVALPKPTGRSVESIKSTAGHRDRLRVRFMNCNAALHDYELLELLLCLAQPRIDVKPVAKALIARFGSFAGAISATEANLRSIKGVGATSVCVLRIVKESATRLLAPTARDLTLNSSRKVLDYCQASMSHQQTEQFRVLYLDSKNGLIKDELQDYGTIDEAPLYVRELIKNAMNYGASGLILIHNHPSGDPTPSQSDISLTQEVYQLALSLNIHLHDHLIVARGNYFSFRAEGMLR
jgi:DNA repair protein RadC